MAKRKTKAGKINEKRLTRSQLASVLNDGPLGSVISYSGLQNWNVQGCPRNADGKTYNIYHVAAWLCLERSTRKRPVEKVDDPLLVGSSSPALERYRRIRADRETLELAIRRGELWEVEDSLKTWRNICRDWKALVDRLMRILCPKCRRNFAGPYNEGVMAIYESIETAAGDIRNPVANNGAR